MRWREYQSNHVIGHGLFSDVYRSDKEGTVVLLKVTEPDDERPPHSSEVEVKLLNSLRHDNVITLIESFSVRGELVMVMPFYPETLRDVLNLNCKMSLSLDLEKVRRNKLQESVVIDVTHQLISLLKYIHSQGVVHRDLKLENVLYKEGAVVLLDLGILWCAPDRYGVEPVKVCDVSTGIYKAPELIFGYKEYSEKIDIWSFGIMLTELYSDSGQSVLDDDTEGDFQLLFKIVEVFGTEMVHLWDEVKEYETFQMLNFADQQGWLVERIIPRCRDGTMKQMFREMMRYQSSSRIGADEMEQLLSSGSSIRG